MSLGTNVQKGNIMDKFDTIAAVSTPPGTGGISCIRISGEKAFKIAARVFNCSKKFEEIESHTVTYGKIINRDKELLDEVLLLKMKMRNYQIPTILLF